MDLDDGFSGSGVAFAARSDRRRERGAEMALIDYNFAFRAKLIGRNGGK